MRAPAEPEGANGDIVDLVSAWGFLGRGYPGAAPRGWRAPLRDDRRAVGGGDAAGAGGDGPAAAAASEDPGGIALRARPRSPDGLDGAGQRLFSPSGV
ncbi:hypothetical protein GCM10010245_07090 [Streptomyces spectabilis]|nr:hypothetical protein GCM10010245_07090 [Streptomyces spectabilis]